MSFRKKGINKKNFGYISRICREAPPWTDLHEIWHRGSPPGRNQLCQIFWQSVQGSPFCMGSNFALLHWPRLSPLIQCCATARLWLVSSTWCHPWHHLYVACEMTQVASISNIFVLSIQQSAWLHVAISLLYVQNCKHELGLEYRLWLNCTEGSRGCSSRIYGILFYSVEVSLKIVLIIQLTWTITSNLFAHLLYVFVLFVCYSLINQWINMSICIAPNKQKSSEMLENGDNVSINVRPLCLSVLVSHIVLWQVTGIFLCWLVPVKSYQYR